MKSKEKTNFYFEVDDPIYNVPLIFIVGSKEYYKNVVVKKLKYEWVNSINCGGESMLVFDEQKGEANTIVWIPRLNFSISNYSTIAHEILHATFHTLKMIGIKLDYENQEPINYYFDFLFDGCLAKLVKIYHNNKR